MRMNLRSALLGSLFAAFSTAAVATDVDMNISVDNTFDVYISDDAALAGTLIGSGVGWTPTNNFVQTLVDGETNYIHVIATNTGTPSAVNPGAFLGQFDLSDGLFEFANGTQTLLTCAVADCGWLAGAAPPATSTPVFLFDHGSGPWDGQPIAGIDPAADWIWLDAIGDTQTPVVVFTAAIVPVETDISITVVDAPDPVTAGSGTGNLTHTFTVTNTGNAASGVQTTITGAVLPVGVTIDDITITGGGTFDGNTLVWDIGAMADGASETLTITLTVPASVPDGEVISATMNLTGLDQVDSDPSNNTDVVDPTDVIRSATFDITKIWDGGEVAVQLTCGGVEVDSATTSGLAASFTYTGFGDAIDCTVTETVPSGYAPVYTGCDATPVTSGQTYSCEIANDTSAAGFTVTKTFSDSTTDDVEVSISCDDGFLNATTATIAGDGIDSFRFIATEFINGAMTCTISETSETEGYEQSDPCVFENVTAGEYTCELTNDAEPGTFSVTKTWDISGAGSQTVVDQDVTLVIDCDSDISNPMPLPCDIDTPDSTQCVWTLDWDGLGLGDSVTASVEVDTTGGDASCTAYEMGIDSSEVESVDNCEDAMVVEAAGSNGCEITNTVFFEGIPTLSQYGLALMALLMLGVGMIGFRRFA